jgi:L-ascorbate metabolism protein UlaG (beta-lactamase superfamily)
MVLKTLGKNPPKEAITPSPNYKKGAFENLNPTEVTLKETSMIKMLREYRNRPKNTVPNKPIPYIKTDLTSLSADKPSIVWFGHSSYLIKSKETTVLVDPVFNGYASPFPFFAKAFKGADGYGVTDFDSIDVLVITHDHYDHLDYATIKAIHPKVKHIVTSLGVGNHLVYWGVPKEKITELDWWDSKVLDSKLKFTAAPARHFSGRSFKRGQTLWGSFVLNIHDHQIYIGADSGYDNHFKTIGERFGGFDFALLECGQYGKNWPYIHMMPEQTLQAAIDINTKVLMPVHWAKFTLALHPWNEPIQRLIAVKDKFTGDITTPKIGETVVVGNYHPNEVWWEF